MNKKEQSYQTKDNQSSVNEPTRPFRVLFDKNESIDRADNKELAKLMIIENSYHLIKFEFNDIDISFVKNLLDIEAIGDSNTFNEVITLQLIRAWEYIINTNDNFSYDTLLKLHKILAKNQALTWGEIRDGKVGVSGTNFKPPIPTKDIVEDILYTKNKDSYVEAMSMLVRLIKTQPFWDGNKRSAFLITNKYMIDNALGLVVVDDDNFEEFNSLLSKYYDDAQVEEELIGFLIDKCIFNSLTKKPIQ